jgi:hypothetical protein
MSRDIVPTCLETSFHVSRSTVGLVVAGRVQREFSHQLTVFGEYPDLKSIDEHQDPRPHEPTAQSDVV